MTQAMPEITLRRWVKPEDSPFAEPVFLFDSDELPEELSRVSVVLRSAGLERARELLALGAERVLLGEAVLLDSSLIEDMVREFGSERVGVWAPARRQEISWALDLHSNADFRCVTPSYAKPAWEVLKSDGSGSGTDAGWWLAQMLERGASLVLLGVDIADDADLNLCAELVERFSACLWLTPLANPEVDLLPWIQFGQARNLAIPNSEHYDEVVMSALCQALEPAIAGVA
ncbi:HisA/HisF-related TIM barrel protein [Thiobacillus sp.]|uniref:HisA/HisF-related TIM barrel protein n=1 Tax=Thiobacillus sp. TaxID=924 RepID=UPI0025DAB969|nr:HisA/HisF-related TIM barrel protein [Thiobacillus sp.]